MGQKKCFDSKKFTSYAGETIDEVHVMGELFNMQAEIYLQALSDSVTEKNPEQWAETAHKLKGMASFVGAERLCEVCETAEVTHTEFYQNAAQILPDIKKETVAVAQALQAYIRKVKEEV